MSAHAPCSVYVICEAESNWERPPVKVGMATNPHSRLAQLQTGSPRRLMVLHWFPCPHKDIAREVERTFHELHADVRLEGEWFDLKPYDAVGRVGHVIMQLVQQIYPEMTKAELGRFLIGSGLADVFSKVAEFQSSEQRQ